MPHDQKGLSFSSSFKELKRLHRLFSKKGMKSVDIRWVIQDCDLPPNMKFVQDKKPKKQDHYFLTVTERMTIEKLVFNLNWVADRMSVIRDAGETL